MNISTHVLDMARGEPASGVRVSLEAIEGGAWKLLADAVTNEDGRIAALLPPGFPLKAARYRLTFDTAGRGFYPEVVVTVEIKDPMRHYHLPLLLSPFGYSTYRGS